jgi:hypothetical protein
LKKDLMMTENDAADIAWMRRLAEENAQAPFRGASILTAAGLIYGGASVVHWATITGLIHESGPISGVIWLIATGVFLAFLVFASLRLRRREGVMTAANRAAAAVWTGVGWGTFALFGAMAVGGWRTGGEGMVAFVWLIPSIIMVFYGMGWAVTAAMVRSRPLWGLAIASFAAAPLLALMAGSAAQYLAYAAALFLLMALPDFLLMRAARTDRA